MFLEQKISIIKWLLKDHVTLKTGVMADENSACPLIYYKCNLFL